MNPEPNRRREEVEREPVIYCEYIEAKMISGAITRKYPDYDFWCIDERGNSGLYIGSGLEEELFYQVVGYAMAMLDVLRGIKG